MRSAKTHLSAVVLAATLPLLAGCVSGKQITMQNSLAACDGYGNMERNADGITELGAGFWTAPGSRYRRAPNSVPSSVSSCSTAVAMLDADFPENWMRKVSLLQSRALHNVAAGDPQAALADLDAADAAAQLPDDPFYRRSLAVNSQFIRAFALAKDGRQAEALALTAEAASSRPYIRDAHLAALTVAKSANYDPVVEGHLISLGRIHPSLTVLRFRYLFETGRFEEALAVAPTLSVRRTVRDQTSDRRTSMYNVESHRSDAAIFWADVEGRRGYALSALGRVDEVEPVLAAARQAIDKAIVTPPPLPPEPTNEDRIRHAVQTQVNREIETKAIPAIEAWRGLIAARIAVEGKDIDTAEAITGGVKLPSPTLVELSLVPAKDGSGRAIDRLSDHEKSLLLSLAVGLPPNTTRALFEFLIDAETVERAQQTMVGMDYLFASDGLRERGACKEPKRNDGLESICFRGTKASPSITEERTLLRAAERALGAGATHFIVENRSDTRHSTVTTQYGVPIAEHEAGFETAMDVRLLKADEVKLDCWRCLDAQAVYDKLAPVYRIQGENS